jgi:hypothetical protein
MSTVGHSDCERLEGQLKNLVDAKENIVFFKRNTEADRTV